MALRIKKCDITREIAENIASECIIKETLSYIQIKNKAVPKIINMYSGDDIYFKIPYFVGLKYGFKPNENWYQIHDLEYNDGCNIPIIKESWRPFIGEFRDYQEPIIQEILEQIDENFTSTFGLPPGWGKTMGGIFCGWRLGLRICVIVPLINVLEGFMTTCQKFVPHLKLWIVGSNHNCPDDVDIILCMDGRFSDIPLHIKNSIGTLILDEVHLLCSTTRVEIFLNIFPKYVILESATITKNNGMHKMAHLIAGEHGVFRVSKKPYDIFIVDTEIKGEEEYGPQGLISSKLRQNLVLNKTRQNVILMMLITIINYCKVMCIQMVKAAIPEFVERVKGCGITCDCLYGSKKDYKNSQVLVGTQQKMGVGFDEENKCNDFFLNPVKADTIFLLNTTPDVNIYEQARGRARNLKYVVIFRDLNSNCDKHIKSLEWWFKETNGTVYYISYKQFCIPNLTVQIFNRGFHEQIFYKSITEKQLQIFFEYGILDEDKYDEKIGNMVIYDDINSVPKNDYIFYLNNLNIAYGNINNNTIYVATCPIFYFHIQEIVKC